ncbi:MAG: dihydroorotate dehydrogenase [Kosmotoga sp.]|uniref:Dihydroorotate dehydrogenase n=1 Tax=Kosmotoga arenicorallina TaxID=688066 RepID=A0A7C5DUR8_9BACT|nr:hypothetical protein [Kosmotoga sp.]MBO8167206.1 dihydroorotate dehydrogenase [Kosmotoga sp.]HHF08345.1 dihydroorotate dehydrogenase [Kosmotoga arenicorallina]
MANLTREVMGITFKNPVVIPSGPGGFGLEMEKDVLSKIGAFTIKSVTLEPKEGNPSPRLVDAGYGLINSIGLQNPGIKTFLNTIYPKLLPFPTKLFFSIAGNSPCEFREMAAVLNGVEGFDLLVLNLSCPNVEDANTLLGANPESVAEILKQVKTVFTTRPVTVKLPPEIPDFPSVIRACENNGADGLVLFNCITGARFDIETGKPFLKRTYGGYSGPAVKPIYLRKIHLARQLTKLPIIGMGGAYKWDDIFEYLLAGAELVGFGLRTMVDPLEVAELPEKAQSWLCKHGFADLTDYLLKTRKGELK